MSIGERLRSARIKKGLGISELARIIDISPSTYRDWENGSLIKGEPYLRLAHALDISLYYLMSGNESNIYRLLDDLQSKIAQLKMELHS